MREVLKEILHFKIKGRGCVPNLRGASPVGRGEGRSSSTAMATNAEASRRGSADGRSALGGSKGDSRRAKRAAASTTEEGVAGCGVEAADPRRSWQ